MNKTEMTTKISERSGVAMEDCQKVVDAFEEVLNEELLNSKDIGNAFDKIYKLLSFFKNKNNS